MLRPSVGQALGSENERLIPAAAAKFATIVSPSGTLLQHETGVKDMLGALLPSQALLNISLLCCPKTANKCGRGLRCHIVLNEQGWSEIPGRSAAACLAASCSSAHAVTHVMSCAAPIRLVL